MSTSTSIPAAITRIQVPDHQRMKCTADLFGINFPFRLEPFIYSITENIAQEYKGGYWQLNKLSNNGFYMSPHSDTKFHVCCENGFEGDLSADALGIIACLYAYSNLSFGDPDEFTEICAQQFHLLREYMFEHPEVESILRAID